MGTCCGSAPGESDHADRPVRRAANVRDVSNGEREEIVDRQHVLANWDRTFPAITRSELQKRRTEFWESRTSGRPQIWQTMRLAADADPDTAQAILSSAGLTSYDIDKPESCFLYDELGNRYDVPLYVLYVPRNILSDDAAAVAQAGEIGVAAAAAPGLEQKSQGGDVLIKLRLSTGEPDLEVKAKTFNTISDVKKLLQHMKTIKMEKQKVLFMGRLLPDASTLGAAGLQDGNVLQIMVSS